jgi:hypothetical protein
MLFGFLMIRVRAATATELAELKSIGRGLLVLGRKVVPTLTNATLEHNIIAWHNLSPIFVLCPWYFVFVRCQWSVVRGLAVHRQHN